MANGTATYEREKLNPRDFVVQSSDIIGKNYNRTRPIPYIPDVLRATRDPLLARQGLLVYGEMLRDDMVDLGLSLLSSVLAPEIRFVPADDTAEAKLIADKLARQWDAMPGGPTNRLYKILLAFAFGFSLSEQCFGLVAEGEDAGDVALKDIKYRQPYFFDFIASPTTGELERIVQVDTSGGEIKDISREKMLHFIVNDHIDPFRGASIYRPAYASWWQKQSYIKQRGIQAERRTGKLKIDHTDRTLLSDSEFNDIANAVLDGYQNADGFKTPPGMSVEVLQGEAEPESWTNLITACDRVILRPTKIPWLMVQEGIDTGSYALAEIQERVMTGGHAIQRSNLESLLNGRDGPVWWPVKLNGWSMSDKPTVVLSPAIEADRKNRIELFNASAGAGTLKPQPQDQNWLRLGIGLEEMDESATAEEDKTVQALALNGAQIQSATGIVEQVAAGTLPVSSARAMLTSFLPIPPDAADAILKSFLIRPPTAAPEAAPPVVEPGAEMAEEVEDEFSEMGDIWREIKRKHPDWPEAQVTAVMLSKARRAGVAMSEADPIVRLRARLTAIAERHA